MDTAYLKMMAGPRLNSHAGLKMEPGFEYKYGKNYLYLEVPVLGVQGEDGKITMEVKRNQHVFIRAACIVDIRGNNMLEIEPNQVLAESGNLQASYKLHPGSGSQPIGFHFTARRDVDLSGLEYAVRIYMPA